MLKIKQWKLFSDSTDFCTVMTHYLCKTQKLRMNSGMFYCAVGEKHTGIAVWTSLACICFLAAGTVFVIWWRCRTRGKQTNWNMQWLVNVWRVSYFRRYLLLLITHIISETFESLHVIDIPHKLILGLEGHIMDFYGKKVKQQLRLNSC